MNRRTPIPPDQQPWTRRWAIFFLATALFVISQFYRMSVAVISPDLIKDLSLDTRGLSLATSAFFYAFAVTQIPIGICLDRIGTPENHDRPESHRHYRSDGLCTGRFHKRLGCRPYPARYRYGL